ncbi:MAG: hypothetical protein AAF549_08415 [Pseudomonadota bacterium]
MRYPEHFSTALSIYPDYLCMEDEEIDAVAAVCITDEGKAVLQDIENHRQEIQVNHRRTNRAVIIGAAAAGITTLVAITTDFKEAAWTILPAGGLMVGGVMARREEDPAFLEPRYDQVNQMVAAHLENG